MTQEFIWTKYLLETVKTALEENLTGHFVALPVNKETIRLDKAIHADESGIIIDYNQIETLYMFRFELISFLYDTGVFSFDEALNKHQPVIALDVDGVLADIQSMCKMLVPEWDETEYLVPGIDFGDFNYLGLAVKDRPKFRFKYILTSRPPQYTEDTKVWLNMHDIEYDVIINSADKLSVMNAFEIDILIDDNPETYTKVTNGGKICYLYDCTYNRHIKTDRRIYGLSQVEKLI